MNMVMVRNEIANIDDKIYISQLQHKKERWHMLACQNKLAESFAIFLYLSTSCKATLEISEH